MAEDAWTRSFGSQVERGRITPSLETLSEIARRLDVTVSALMGDESILRAAKATLFTPDVCQRYLDQLPETETKRVLVHLVESLVEGTVPSCELPPSPELHALTARVLMQQERCHRLVVRYAELGDSEAEAPTQTLLGKLYREYEAKESLREGLEVLEITVGLEWARDLAV